MTSKPATNTEVWEQIYRGGHRMWYPSEALVRIVRRHEKLEGFAGTTLDHGCGSGAAAEFVVRSGHKVVCTDVSEEALRVTRQRFDEAGLPAPQTVRIDAGKPLSPQLPDYDHLFAWLSVYYNTKAEMRQQLSELIARLPKNGAFIMAVPTINDVVVGASELLTDGTRQLRRNISGQNGALLTIPESRDELIAFCDGIDVRDVVTFGMTFAGERNENFAVYGVRR